jgi:aminopeptidase N
MADFPRTALPASGGGKGGGAPERRSVATPTEEVHLIAAPFTEYSRDAGAVKAMAFLRKPDQALADRYLDATAQYLEMYRGLLGPYPYSKFALVENFWETGYGMPSFTLLGEQIIRFPFILYTSYPHELLHNWWGNGVFVDLAGGNWCEGLTAYLADHLVAEQRGQGADHRRAILRKVTDYVTPENDFPLSRFHSRYIDAVRQGTRRRQLRPERGGAARRDRSVPSLGYIEKAGTGYPFVPAGWTPPPTLGCLGAARLLHPA